MVEAPLVLVGNQLVQRKLQLDELMDCYDILLLSGSRSQKDVKLVEVKKILFMLVVHGGLLNL